MQGFVGSAEALWGCRLGFEGLELMATQNHEKEQNHERERVSARITK